MNKPKYLDDYYINNDDNICNVDTVDYCYKLYTNKIVPETYDEAMASNDAPNWKNDMQDEIDSLNDNKTWTIKKCPPGERVIEGRWA